MNDLNIDISPAEEARALHRVVRAMHDGHCPSCGLLAPSEAFYVPSMDIRGSWSMTEAMHRCPACEFVVTESEAIAALATFREFMAKNLEVFINWRHRLIKENSDG